MFIIKGAAEVIEVYDAVNDGVKDTIGVESQDSIVHVLGADTNFALTLS